MAMSQISLSEELAWRGFAHQTTYKDSKTLDTTPITFYLGVDPSAPSMTIGNLAAIMMVKHFISHGHKAVLLVGGATGMIGDPDGKKQERNLLTLEEIQSNKLAIVSQYEQILGKNSFRLVDNYDWFKEIGYLQFLRDVGKHVPMRQMLARDFVESRLSEAGAGISYAEFSYVLIQAYDFLHMNREMGVSLQLCGSDQWGNSIAGVDLIRRLTGNEAHVWSAPLIVNRATGQKFGKTEGGAVWLDAAKTSVYRFYQFWLNVDDEGVEDYLKIFTELDKPSLDTIMQEFEKDKATRSAQKTLAYEVTKIVHGSGRAEAAVKVTDLLFKGTIEGENLSEAHIEILKSEMPFVHASSVLEGLLKGDLASSNTEANRLLASGAVKLNGEKITQDQALHKTSLLKKGKNSFALIAFG
jgi:tyrosyl-tRNA synthetase